MIFHTIDVDHNGIIDVEEWLLYAAIMSRANQAEILDFQFKVYDTNEDGFISFSELVNIIKCQIISGNLPVHELNKHSFLWDVGRRTPEALAEDLMRICDTDHDHQISKQEFEGVQNILTKMTKYATEN